MNAYQYLWILIKPITEKNSVIETLSENCDINQLKKANFTEKFRPNRMLFLQTHLRVRYPSIIKNKLHFIFSQKPGKRRDDVMSRWHGPNDVGRRTVRRRSATDRNQYSRYEGADIAMVRRTSVEHRIVGRRTSSCRFLPQRGWSEGIQKKTVVGRSSFTRRTSGSLMCYFWAT